MKKAHDQSILRRSFKPSQKVLLYNSRLHLFLGKLKSRWTGPFIIRSVFPHGVMYKLNVLASARIVCNIMVLQVRGRTHRELYF
jgi:hypothetical protein